MDKIKTMIDVEINKFDDDDYIKILSKVYDVKVIEKDHLYIDDKQLVGHFYILKKENYHMVLVDFELKEDLNLKIFYHTNFQYTSVLFGNNINYIDANQQKVELNTANGIVLMDQHQDHLYIYDKKGTRVQRVTLFFNHDNIDKLIKDRYNSIESYLVLSANNHLVVMKKILFLYERMHEQIRMGWFQNKAEELFFVIQNILLNTEKATYNTFFTAPEIEKAFAIKNEIDLDLKVKPVIEDLTQKYGLNTNKLTELFKHLFSNTVYNYYKEERLLKIHYDLIHTDKTVTDLTYEYGFTDSQHLSRSFKAHFKITPSEHKKRNSK